MYSIATGTMPAPMIAATHWLASSAESKPNSTGRAPSAARNQPHRRLGDDAELALGAARRGRAGRSRRASIASPPRSRISPSRVTRRTPRRLLVVTPYLRQCAPPEFIADVAADRAGELRGRIGRVEEAVGADRLGNREIGDAGLDPRIAVGEVDLEDAAHLGQADDDRVFLRDGAAGERRAGAARHDIDASSRQSCRTRATSSVERGSATASGRRR